jgi:elongation factor G
VLKAAYAGQSGKMAYARVFQAPLGDGAEFILPDGQKARAGGLFQVQGAALRKIAEAPVGDIAAIGKVEQAAAGQILSTTGRPQQAKTAARSTRSRWSPGTATTTSVSPPPSAS